MEEHAAFLGGGNLGKERGEKCEGQTNKLESKFLLLGNYLFIKNFLEVVIRTEK